MHFYRQNYYHNIHHDQAPIICLVLLIKPEIENHQMFIYIFFKYQNDSDRYTSTGTLETGTG